MRLTQFSAIATKDKVDADNGVIHGVSVLTQGDAQGHGFRIDHTTVSQVVALGAKLTDGLKVRMNHPAKGADAALQSIVGSLRNFRIEDGRARADLHLLKSDPYFTKLVELAQKMPEAFGLSIAFDNEIEKQGEVQLARCKEIFACDLVDSPAANPTGLFSVKEPETPKPTFMSKVFATALGLPETATEAEIATALKTQLSAKPAVDETKLSALQTQITGLQKSAENATALSQKAEIDNLMAEAARDGKVVPLDNADLYEVKDGTVTIHTTPAQLSKMISKLPKGQVTLSKKPATAPADKDGKPLDGEARREWCLSKQREGATQLSELMASQIKTTTN